MQFLYVGECILLQLSSYDDLFIYVLFLLSTFSSYFRFSAFHCCVLCCNFSSVNKYRETLKFYILTS